MHLGSLIFLLHLPCVFFMGPSIALGPTSLGLDAIKLFLFFIWNNVKRSRMGHLHQCYEVNNNCLIIYFLKLQLQYHQYFRTKKIITTHSIIFIVGHPKLLILQWNKNYSHFLKRKLLLWRNLIIREWVGTTKLHQMGLNIYFFFLWKVFFFLVKSLFDENVPLQIPLTLTLLLFY